MKANDIGIFIKTIFPNFEESLKEKIDKSDLTDREKKILNMRLFQGNTLDECAKEFDVTRERIRQVESKAYRKMRHPMFRLTVLDDFDYLKRFETFKGYRAKFYDELFDREEVLKSEEVKIEKEKTLENIYISECGFSPRTYNCLYREGIRSLKDLSEYSTDELLGVRNLGRKSFAEIVEKTDEIPNFMFKN